MKLIVVDVQKAIAVDELYNRDGLLANVAKLIEAARENGVEVIYVQHDDGPGSGFTQGDEAFEIADEVAPRGSEKIFIKKINSAFGSREFTAYLEAARDDTLMIVGLQTNYCIDATVKSAFERGYRVILPEGTNSTFDNPFMTGKKTCEYYFKMIWPNRFAKCVSMDEALVMLRGAEKEA